VAVAEHLGVLEPFAKPLAWNLNRHRRFSF
jgi:hypothetical protein